MNKFDEALMWVVVIVSVCHSYVVRAITSAKLVGGICTAAVVAGICGSISLLLQGWWALYVYGADQKVISFYQEHDIGTPLMSTWLATLFIIIGFIASRRHEFPEFVSFIAEELNESKYL